MVEQTAVRPYDVEILFSFFCILFDSDAMKNELENWKQTESKELHEKVSVIMIV